ncbi:MAG: ABC-F family ATP-binding cassette domain-containing protein [Alphaproteobacteria bacterium]
MFPSLVLDRVSIRLPDGRVLFPEFSCSFSDGPVGLVGRNGCGKSSLLHIMAGMAACDIGAVSTNGTVTLFDQHLPNPDDTLAAALGVEQALACLARLLDGKGNVEDAAAADWLLEDRLTDCLSRADLPTGLDLNRPVRSLSGGEQMRLGLARLWLYQPDILLLDEPTNNLDAAGAALIERLVRDWPGLVIMASHDRALLEHMSRIVELTPQAVHVTGGGWSAHQAEQEARRDRAVVAMDRARSEVAQQKRAAEQRRIRAARSEAKGKALRRSGGVPRIVLNQWKTQATAAAGRSTNLSTKRTEQAEGQLADAQAEIERLTPLSLDLPPCNLPAGRDMVRVTDLGFCHDGADQPVFDGFDLAITGPERLAVNGRNGAGKTTLLRHLAGELTPDTGEIALDRHQLGYLDQQLSLLDHQGTVLSNLQDHAPRMTAQKLREHAARFAFRGDRAMQMVSTLSGGERLRVALACLFARSNRPSLLMLDEPTNHLDLSSRTELEQCLAAWDGALIVISHDPAFVQAVGVTRQLVIG